VLFGLRNRVAVGQFKKYNIKIMLGSGSELGGVRVWRAGPFFIHTLELRFKRQIFTSFIVDYIYQKGFKILRSWTILLSSSYLWFTQIIVFSKKDSSTLLFAFPTFMVTNYWLLCTLFMFYSTVRNLEIFSVLSLPFKF
jgi:hypothetical protein